MFRAFIAILFAVLYLILGIPVLGVEWLIGKKNKHLEDVSSLHMVQWAFRVICKICAVKVTVIGHENIPENEPVLYVANHNSYFDIIIAYALCPDLTGFIAKDSIEKVPMLNIWMRRLYCLFLKRDDMKQSLKVILQAIDYIKQGVSIFIFPEGTRGKSEEVTTFKEGSMKIADKTGCAIIPVTINNSRYVLMDHIPHVKPTHVIVEYGKPIYPKELSKEDRKNLGRLTQNVVEETFAKNKAQYPAYYRQKQ